MKLVKDTIITIIKYYDEALLNNSFQPQTMIQGYALLCASIQKMPSNKEINYLNGLYLNYIRYLRENNTEKIKEYIFKLKQEIDIIRGFMNNFLNEYDVKYNDDEEVVQAWTKFTLGYLSYQEE